MNEKYISSSALLYLVLSIQDGAKNKREEWLLNQVVEKINFLPAARVELIVQGKYITDDLGDSSCSVCGENWLNVTHKRCPNCGAFLERNNSK